MGRRANDLRDAMGAVAAGRRILSPSPEGQVPGTCLAVLARRHRGPGVRAKAQAPHPWPFAMQSWRPEGRVPSHRVRK